MRVMSADEKEDPFVDLKLPPSIKSKIAEHYSSLATLGRASPQELAEQIGISQRLAKNAVNLARKALDQGVPTTASDLLKQYRSKRRLTTGSQNLDEILGGGIPTGSITELVGEFATGKSQLAFQLCVNVQLPAEYGGLEGSAYFLDTEGTFSPKRVYEIAYAKKNLHPELSRPEEMLSKVFVGRAFNAEHQIKLILEADKLITKENIRLIVIDSIAAHFRAEFSGKESLPARAQALMTHASHIQRYAESYDLAVVTTNQVLASIDKFLGNTQSAEPALGFAWGHRPQTRIFLRKQKGNARIARIIDSSELPEQETLFYITADGIQDSFGIDEQTI